MQTVARDIGPRQTHLAKAVLVALAILGTVVVIAMGATLGAGAHTSAATIRATISVESDVDLASSAGEVVTFTVVITNRGGDSFEPVVSNTINGAELALDGPSGDDDGNGLLDTGEAWAYSGPYQVAQSDLELGTSLVDVACAGDLNGDGIEDCAEATVELAPDQVVNIVKLADVETFESEGDPIHYTVIVSNDGDVSSVPNVSDLMNGVPLDLGLPTGDIDRDGRLDVDEQWRYDVTYVVTADDVAAGDRLINVACVALFDQAQCWEARVDKAIRPESRLELRKVFGGESIRPGDAGSFELLVTNHGSQALEGVQVQDVVDERLVVTDVSGANCSETQMVACSVDLAAGETVTVMVDYAAEPYLGMEESFATRDGAAFRFEFENGYVLEGASDKRVTLYDPDGAVVQTSKVKKRNDFRRVTPDGDTIDIHLSCSELYTDGFDEDWVIESYTIWRHRKASTFRGCGSVLQAVDVINTATAAWGDILVAARDTVSIESDGFVTNPLR